jgi:hypothetical protein
VPILGVTLVVLGITWLVVFYLTSGFFDFEALAPLAKLRYWNLGIGFGAIVASLIVFTKWR